MNFQSLIRHYACNTVLACKEEILLATSAVSYSTPLIRTVSKTWKEEYAPLYSEWLNVGSW